MVFEVILNENSYKVEVESIDEYKFKVILEGKEYYIDVYRVESNLYSLILEGRSYEVDIEEKEGCLAIFIDGDLYQAQVLDEKKKRLPSRGKSGLISDKQILSSPMPGRVVKILVEVGASVEVGQGLIVVEAMKMENELKSSITGKVKEIFVSEGDAVDAGTKLMVIE